MQVADILSYRQSQLLSSETKLGQLGRAGVLCWLNVVTSPHQASGFERFHSAVSTEQVGHREQAMFLVVAQ